MKECSIFVSLLLIYLPRSQSLTCNTTDCVTYNMHRDGRSWDVPTPTSPVNVITINAQLVLENSCEKSEIVMSAQNETYSIGIEFKIETIENIYLVIFYGYNSNIIMNKIKYELSSVDNIKIDNGNINLALYFLPEDEQIDDNMIAVYTAGADTPTYIKQQNDTSDLWERVDKYSVSLRNTQHVSVSTPECYSNLSISFCPCLKPVVLDLQWTSDSEVKCVGSGVAPLGVEWWADGLLLGNSSSYSISSELVPINDTIISTLEVLSKERNTRYTCVVKNGVYNTTAQRGVDSRKEEVDDIDKRSSKYYGLILGAIISVIIIVVFVVVLFLVFKIIPCIKRRSSYQKAQDQECPSTDSGLGNSPGTKDTAI